MTVPSVAAARSPITLALSIANGFSEQTPTCTRLVNSLPRRPEAGGLHDWLIDRENVIDATILGLVGLVGRLDEQS